MPFSWYRFWFKRGRACSEIYIWIERLTINFLFEKDLFVSCFDSGVFFFSKLFNIQTCALFFTIRLLNKWNRIEYRIKDEMFMDFSCSVLFFFSASKPKQRRRRRKKELNEILVAKPNRDSNCVFSVQKLWIRSFYFCFVSIALNALSLSIQTRRHFKIYMLCMAMSVHINLMA